MEKQHFQAEVSELLQLIIHSLYSHPEIFLRELISNASDALDRLKLEALTDAGKDLMPQGYAPEIWIRPDREHRTLTVQDNGIGMSVEEVRENLGRIAHSGTKQFVEMKRQLQENPELIGQFGVGFYSSFIVADRVVVETRRAGSATGVRWQSDGKGEFSVEPCEKPDFGTSVILHLKKSDGEEGGLADYTEEWVLRGIVKKHSDFISYPIKMPVEREKTEDGQSTKTVEEQVLNSQKALWLRAPAEVKPEEYTEFYGHVAHDFAAPLKTVHFKAEGTQEFSALLFVPENRPWNYDNEGYSRGVALYVRRVLIMNDCEALLPLYLRFVRGVVDSSDLPLNVSREILQHDRQVVQIRKALVGRVLKALSEMLEGDREHYERFWKQFGSTLKEGIVREPEKKDKLEPLLLFHSLSENKLTTLAEYAARMKPDQPHIYYLSAESLEQAQHSPHLEMLRKKGYEVLVLTDPVDDFIIGRLDPVSGKPFQSVTAQDLELAGDEEKQQDEAALKEKEQEFGMLLVQIKEALKDEVKDVRLSKRLTDSLACLVNEVDAGGVHLEQLYRQMGQEPPKRLRILELNPAHPVLEKMRALPPEAQSQWSELIYGQALLSEGSRLKDPSQFSKRITELMLRAQ